MLLDYNSAPDKSLDTLQVISFGRVAEGNRHAVRTRAGGASNPMDIAFRLVRQFEIDYMSHAVDVDAARTATRAAISVATRTRIAFDLKPLSARCRAVCDLLP